MFPKTLVLFCPSSSAAGDWVNCGLCGEWAHFGCDRRQGLGAFKVSINNQWDFDFLMLLYLMMVKKQDYAKTDGLEYVCPHCSITNYKRKSAKLMNGFSKESPAPRLV